jgi:hypothetical protein
MNLRVVLVCALVAFGCRKGADQNSTDVEPPASGASARAAPEPVSAPLAVEDFEEEAARQINGDNIEAELAQLEQEVRQK